TSAGAPALSWPDDAARGASCARFVRTAARSVAPSDPPSCQYGRTSPSHGDARLCLQEATQLVPIRRTMSGDCPPIEWCRGIDETCVTRYLPTYWAVGTTRLDGTRLMFEV